MGLNVRETEVWKLLFEGLDEFGTDLVLLVVFFVVIAFLDAGVAADGRNIDHAIPGLWSGK